MKQLPMNVVAANLITVVAAATGIVGGVAKEKKNIVYCQIAELFLCIAGNMLLSAIAGAVSNVIGIISNLLWYNGKYNNKTRTVLIVAALALIIITNKQGVVGFIPIIPTISYLITLNMKGSVPIKISVMCAAVLWAIYDFMIQSYVGSFFDMLTVISCIVGLYRILRDKKPNGSDLPS